MTDFIMDYINISRNSRGCLTLVVSLPSLDSDRASRLYEYQVWGDNLMSINNDIKTLQVSVRSPQRVLLPWFYLRIEQELDKETLNLASKGVHKQTDYSLTRASVTMVTKRSSQTKPVFLKRKWAMYEQNLYKPNNIQVVASMFSVL